jgi:hypothetical protein
LLIIAENVKQLTELPERMFLFERSQLVNTAENLGLTKTSAQTILSSIGPEPLQHLPLVSQISGYIDHLMLLNPQHDTVDFLCKGLTLSASCQEEFMAFFQKRSHITPSHWLKSYFQQKFDGRISVALGAVITKQNVGTTFALDCGQQTNSVSNNKKVPAIIELNGKIDEGILNKLQIQKQGDEKLWYHGTSLAYVEDILSVGIKTRKSTRGDLDFGPNRAFYLAEKLSECMV